MDDCSATTDTSAIFDATLARMTGCVQVTATHEVPNTPLNLEDFNVTLPADFFSARVNTVSFGNTEEERSAFLVNFRDTSVEVVKFGVNFIPFISDGADLLTQLYNQALGNDVDPVLATLASAGLILDATTGGVGDVTAIAKGGYKLSLELAEQGLGGVLATTLRNQVEEVLVGAITARQFVTGLSERFGAIVKLATTRGCGLLGLGCIRQYDRLAAALRTAESLEDSRALARVDLALEDAVAVDYPEANYLEFTNQALREGGDEAPEELTTLFRECAVFGGLSYEAIQTLDLTAIETQAGRAGRVCPPKQRVLELESLHGTSNVHAARDHGPGTNMFQQQQRAKTGYRPSGSDSRAVDATRFYNWDDLQEAIERAIAEYNPTKYPNGRVTRLLAKVLTESWNSPLSSVTN